MTREMVLYMHMELKQKAWECSRDKVIHKGFEEHNLREEQKVAWQEKLERIIAIEEEALENVKKFKIKHAEHFV